MAVNPIRGRAELQMPKKWREKDATSPERTMVWTEPKSKTERKVPVVYYLCRNGHLEHPHFMEVLLSSNEGLYLRDVVNRLNLLRGKGMASMYSWSSKRSYKNGFVWHDLSENDFIYPAHGQEYVLKGSELLEGSINFRSHESLSSSPEKPPQIQEETRDDCDFPVVNRRRNQSWSAIDLHEYKVYKAEPTSEYAGKAADAATQTDEKRRRRRMIEEEDEEIQLKSLAQEEEEEQFENQTTELSRDEISPPPSSSSPETLESLIKAHRRILNVSDGGVVHDQSDIRDQTAGNNHPSGRIKASAVLMQLISCGSISFKDCSSISEKEQQGFSLISHYKSRIPRPISNNNQVSSKEIECLNENPSFTRIQLEDKEYFSGSLIEQRKKDEFSALKRSSSYNADRGGSKLVLREKEIEGVGAKCIPRNINKTSTKKQSNNNNNNSRSINKDNNDVSSRSSRSLHQVQGRGGGGSNN